MNAAKAIEQAMVAVIRQFAETGAVELRAWQALSEAAVSSDHERHFPCVDIRCSPPVTDANGVTLGCRVQVLCVSMVDKDMDHAVVSKIYEAVQATCDNLYKQALNSTVGTTENEIGVFDASLLENAATMTRGGFTFAEGAGPMDEDGLNVIGVAMMVHYSRSDF
jgi:hypothetical protein